MDRKTNLEASLRVAFVVTAAWFAALPAVAADDLCGATVTSNLKLDHDLTCAGDGLIVGADGIKLDLNGHTITGPGTGNGILANGRSGVVITGGTIRNFIIGVQLVASTGVTIKEIRVTGNRDGIFLVASSGNVIKENIAWQNSRVGVMLRPGAVNNSTQNLVIENILSDNANGVILVETPAGNTFEENVISGSTRAGIALNGAVSGNLIKENTLAENALGILFNAGSTGLLPVDNTVVENLIITNSCALAGPISGNVVEENVVQGNGADRCS